MLIFTKNNAFIAKYRVFEKECRVLMECEESQSSVKLLEDSSYVSFEDSKAIKSLRLLRNNIVHSEGCFVNRFGVKILNFYLRFVMKLNEGKRRAKLDEQLCEPRFQLKKEQKIHMNIL